MEKRNKKRYCAITKCANSVGTANENIAFFQAPKDSQIKDQWIHAIQGLVENNVFSGQFLLCEKHFVKGLINRRKDRTLLKHGSIPTIFTELSEK